MHSGGGFVSEWTRLSRREACPMSDDMCYGGPKSAPYRAREKSPAMRLVLLSKAVQLAVLLGDSSKMQR
nr:hypothetical protein CFP56_19274 [Quercus suber]